MNISIFYIAIITLIGTILRLIGFYKAGGLWNDEYVSWYISSIPIGKGFIHGILTQCHMPFYYIYLKFITLFSNSDILLRLSSIIPGIIAIPAMYMVGRGKNKLTGVMCALFTALSSFLIYYSQEVRFYSLLFLFSALSLYFTIRIIQKPNKKNLIGLLIFNFLILFTHTIGFVYVFFDICFICFKLYKQFKNIILKLLITSGILFLTALPFTIKIFTTVSFSQWWASFSFYRVLQFISDYFSPVIANVSLVENLHSFNYITVFAAISSCIAVVVMFAAIFDKYLRYENQIGYIALGTFIVAIIAALTGKLVFESKYIIEIYPILILIFCSTIDSCDKKWFKILVFSIFFSLQFLFVLTPRYVSYLPREEGNKYVAELIQHANLKENDFIVLTYYPKYRFEKYQDFSKFNVLEIHKGNFNEFYLPELTYKQAVIEGKDKYRSTFANSVLPQNKFIGSKLIFEINNQVYFKMKKGQKVSFVFLDSVSFLDENTITNIIYNEQLYKKVPLLYLVFSDIRNEIIKTIPINAKNIRYEALGNWTIVTFEY